MRRLLGVFALYLLVSIAYTWPLLRDIGTRVPSDPADPVFNIGQLWWNATTLPFSRAWWNAPHFYPTEDVAAFTDSLVGIYPIFSPVYWLTRNPILAFNVAYFLTWPLSGFAVYLLVRFIARRDDAAFLAGLAYAFTPYRTAEIAHIQSLYSFYLPIGLLGLHRYREDGRVRWLWIFGFAWLLQSLATGYYMLFGAVLIGLWLLYFCSTGRTWRRGAVIVAAWGIASLPLVPVMFRYSALYAREGFTRTLAEIMAFSAQPRSWFEVTGDIWLWRNILLSGKDFLFPGMTAVVLVLAATTAFALERPRSTGGGQRDNRSLVRAVEIVLVAATLVALLAVGVTLWRGPWSAMIAGVRLRANDINRSLIVALACGLGAVFLNPRTRRTLVDRSPFAFYAAATVVIALLCCGPTLRVGDQAVLSTSPYAWLMRLPGFGQLRVPTRFWMFGILCLAISTGLAFAYLWPLQRPSRSAAVVIVSVGLLLDGWMPTLRMVPAPREWPEVEPPARTEPILELPLGPDWDFDATFRAAGHRRRVVNGISGYNPSHYIALRTALEHRDLDVLPALASLGPVDVVVNKAFDGDGALEKFVANTPGAARISGDPSTGTVGNDAQRVLIRIAKSDREPDLGEPIAIVSVEGFRHREILSNVDRHTQAVTDGRLDTAWEDYPQQPGQWLVLDLGAEREVGGLTHSLGDSFLDFPRRLAIEVSLDGQSWTRAWEGPTAARAFLALVRGPREGAMRFVFAPQKARFVRLLQLASDPRAWHVAELKVHAP